MAFNIERVPHQPGKPTVSLGQARRVRKKTVADLSLLPEHVIEGSRTVIESGVAVGGLMTVERSLAHGHVMAVPGSCRRRPPPAASGSRSPWIPSPATRRSPCSTGCSPASAGSNGSWRGATWAMQRGLGLGSRALVIHAVPIDLRCLRLFLLCHDAGAYRTSAWPASRLSVDLISTGSPFSSSRHLSRVSPSRRAIAWRV